MERKLNCHKMACIQIQERPTPLTLLSIIQLLRAQYIAGIMHITSECYIEVNCRLKLDRE